MAQEETTQRLPIICTDKRTRRRLTGYNGVWSTGSYTYDSTATAQRK